MIMMGDRKKSVAAILGPRDGEKKESGPAMGALHAIAQELIDAVHAKDADGVEAAFRAAFAECDSEPHVEGPHLSED